jgi:hypothetical protein
LPPPPPATPSITFPAIGAIIPAAAPIIILLSNF